MDENASQKYQDVLNKYASDMANLNSPPATEPTISLPPVDAPPMISERSTVIPPTQNSTTPTFIKVLFFISLFVFLGVLSAVGYNFYRSMNSPVSIAPLPTTIPTPAVIGETCLLNDKNYQVGESFPSADGCNTCTCSKDLTISCTDKACDIAPSEPTSPLKPTNAPTTILLSPKKQTLPTSLTSVVKFNAVKSASSNISQDDVTIGESILSGNFASVAFNIKDSSGSAFWLTKIDGSWQVVTGGQEPPACSLLAKYNFPKTFPCNQ